MVTCYNQGDIETAERKYTVALKESRNLIVIAATITKTRSVRHPLSGVQNTAKVQIEATLDQKETCRVVTFYDVRTPQDQCDIANWIYQEVSELVASCGSCFPEKVPLLNGLD